jgi:hypothetical protein
MPSKIRLGVVNALPMARMPLPSAMTTSVKGAAGINRNTKRHVTQKAAPALALRSTRICLVGQK